MRVLIVMNTANESVRDAAMLLAAYLSSQGIDFHIAGIREMPGRDESSRDFVEDVFEGAAEDPDTGLMLDMVVVLGGDGTILRTARFVSGLPGKTPILGINFGHLGFLANSSESGVVAIVAAALAGDVKVETRSNLHVEVVYELDSEIETCEFFALNEISVARGAYGNIVDMDLLVAGDKVAFMRGDGVVISSATGSTAYALSAGGPLVSPGYRGLVVVPLAPHTLRTRAIVTEQNDIVEVELKSECSREEVSLFADGDALQIPGPINRVIVRRGDEPTTLLKYENESFYAQASRVFF